jgi:catechol 2,3-dioxygenase-like lactoylglutathione lyase family enzyme
VSAESLFDGIDTVFYQVCDMDRAIGFYEGVLGLPLLRREGRDWAELKAGDTVLSLAGELATKPHQGGATVVLRASDIGAVESRLAEHDVQRGRIQDMGGARTLEFYDPDGNELLALEALGSPEA